MNSKTTELFNSVACCNWSIIAFTETWLTSSVYDGEIFNNNYNVFRADRDFTNTNYTRGGGVLLAVDVNLSANLLDLSKSRAHLLNTIDILGVKVIINSHTIYIFVIYVPPSTSAADFNTLYEVICSINILHDNDILILGDFNISTYYSCLINGQDNTHVTALNNFMNFLNLSQYNLVCNSNVRILDLVLSTFQCHVSKSEDILLKEDIHHPSLVVTFDLGVAKPEKKFPSDFTNTFNFRRANFPLLYQQLFNTDWSFLTLYTDVDVACASFYGYLSHIFENCVPKYKSSMKRNYPPWFNATIKKDIRRKEKLWRAYKRDQDLDMLTEFKRLRAKIKLDIKNALVNFTSNAENNINSNPNTFWSYINGKRNVTNIANEMLYNGSTIDNPFDIVNAYADFFQKSYSSSQHLQTIGLNHICSRVNTNLMITSVTEAQVLCALKRIKPKFTSGPDGIPAFILRDCASVFAYPLSLLYNLSLKNSQFPNSWKFSKVCPVYKKGDKKEITNFRPITVICNFSKVFELVLFDYMYDHVKNAISPRQHGFIKGRSTVTNLMCITQYISESIDLGFQTDVIYTDFSKAFDRLNHKILLLKLENYGLSNELINLISSYLTSRSQFVSYNGYRSVEYPALSGVPQGSILGPLLFNIYVNDIVDELDVDCLMYADDLKIYSRIQSIYDCERLQQNLLKIHSWSLNNDLLLNVQKCNTVSYTTKKTTITNNYYIDGVILSRQSTFKDLGVIFDTKLSFVSHIETLVADCHKTLGFIVRNSREFANLNTIKLLYLSFIRSKLEYASLIWNPHYEIHKINLEGVQRRFLKFLFLKSEGVYPNIGVPQETLLNKFGLASLNDRRIHFSVTYLHKILHNTLDCSELIGKLNLHVPQFTSRQVQCFYLPTPRTNVLKYSPLYNMCENYNIRQNELDIFSEKL